MIFKVKLQILNFRGGFFKAIDKPLPMDLSYQSVQPMTYSTCTKFAVYIAMRLNHINITYVK